MDLETIVTRLRQSIGNPSISDVADATLQQLVNDCYEEIGDKFRFFKARKVCTFDTIAGISTYTLPTASVELMRVYDMMNKKIQSMTSDAEAQTLRQDETDSSLWGFPTNYTHYRDWIRFIPVPNGIYKMEIYYRVVMTPLSASTDEPIFPLPWHRGILLLSRYNYFELIASDVPKAISARNAYSIWLENKPDEVAEELRRSDRGVIVPTLSEWPGSERLDFDHA